MSPRVSPGRVAQRIRYPNGTASDPFIVSMSKRDMERFAKRILDDQWPEWQGCLDENGRVDVARLDAKKASDDFDSGSARLACAHDGRFWATTQTWSRHIHDWPPTVGGDDTSDRALSPFEFAILFFRDDEAGWHALHGLGIKDAHKAFARAVLRWAPQIEEWS